MADEDKNEDCEFQTIGNIWQSFVKSRLDLSEKIKSGQISETDLHLDVVKARNAYTGAVTRALWGNRHGHDFDLEDELYKVNALLTGGVL